LHTDAWPMNWTAQEFFTRLRSSPENVREAKLRLTQPGFLVGTLLFAWEAGRSLTQQKRLQKQRGSPVLLFLQVLQHVLLARHCLSYPLMKESMM